MWQQEGLLPLPIAVNVSAVELRSENFIHGVRAILAKTGLAPGYLELELTETVLMNDVESAAYVLKNLKTIGVKLALDDFGTGYSSLSYLRHFPIDVLKIDRSFIQEIGNYSKDSILVNAIINMGKSLNCVVLAEGIETPQQNAYLKVVQCAEGQGHLFSRPLPAAKVPSLLKTGILSPA